MRALPGIVCVMILAGAAGACKDEKTEVVSLNVVGDSVPTMTTHTVTTLISDSGQIRYRVTTDNWLVYDEAQVPMWRFPDGLYLEKFEGFRDRGNSAVRLRHLLQSARSLAS